MYLTDHCKMRFLERVKNVNMPKKTKQKKKYMENYLKEAYKHGLTPDLIQDKYLRDYMYSKLSRSNHNTFINKITYYKNNLFLFNHSTCITILEMPEKASNVIDNLIYITNIKTFINSLNESKKTKDWLLKHSKSMTTDKCLKRILINYDNITYSKILNNFPTTCIKYIKNDSNLKKIIINTNKHRDKKTKTLYYYIFALLFMFPKNQILKLQTKIKNNKKSYFTIISNKGITQRQIDVCYKQLQILTNNDIKPHYKHFRVEDNKCFDLINDFINNEIDTYVKYVKSLFKEFDDKNKK